MYALSEVRPARIPVSVLAPDPLSRAGTISQLRATNDVIVVDETDLASAGGFALVVSD